MSHDLSPIDDRDPLMGLLADAAAFGLTPDETAELARLSEGRDDVDLEEFERLAAELYVSLAGAEETPMPDHLRRRCIEQSRDALAPRATIAPTLPGPPPPRRAGPPSWLGWAGAAACLALAVAAWQRPATVDPAVDAARLRDEVLAAGDALTTPLKGTSPGAEASGDLVWSNQRQRGFMRLRGVAANDPKLKQYQLWIFDRVQDERYPVDGGVFDVRDSGEVIIPIRAPIRVVEPYLFAVTEEKPGGVVVSRRDPIVLLGEAPKAGL